MRFSACHRLWLCGTAALAAVLLLGPGLTLAVTHRGRSHVLPRRTAHRRRRYSRRYHHYRRRYIRVHIPPVRVRQIQQALIKAGVLHESPNGRWDRATRDAMRRYQQENGFSPTGLPEAKPLMKLGLGPHSLPPGLAPKTPTKVQAQDDSDVGAASTSQSAKTSASSR